MTWLQWWQLQWMNLQASVVWTLLCLFIAVLIWLFLRASKRETGKPISRSEFNARIRKMDEKERKP